jgi:hypothetical protein
MVPFEPGEKLILARLEDWFLENLEKDALERLKRRVGKLVTFVAERKQGFVEVEFTATEKREKIHVTILVDPSSLERKKK